MTIHKITLLIIADDVFRKMSIGLPIVVWAGLEPEPFNVLAYNFISRNFFHCFESYTKTKDHYSYCFNLQATMLFRTRDPMGVCFYLKKYIKGAMLTGFYN